MLCRKLGNHWQRPRVSIFIFSICHSLYGEYAFSWDSQIEAIQVLASSGNSYEAEEAGKVLLSGLEEGQVVFLLELLGEICLRNKRYRQTADYYLRASKSTGDEKETLRHLIRAADAYYQNGDYDLAAAIYDERYRRDGDEEVLFRYGCALLHSENFEKLEQVTFKDERLRARFDWNRAAYWNRRGDFEHSLHYLEPWIQRGIREIKYYYFYAQMQYRLGRINEALRTIALGKVMGYHGITAETTPLWILQMRLDWEQRYFESARKVEEALRERGELVKILLAKVCGLRKLGDRAMAWAVLEELTVLEKGVAEFLRGEIYIDEGNFSKGLECFRLASNLGGGIRYAARYWEGKVEAYLGNFRKAAAIYEQLLNEVTADGEGGNIQEFLKNILERTYSAISHSTFQNA
ncbi:MAG: tetratricopeptide repeat protein [Puniceicoccales bacterium]|jgi:tetratricopeptide (TPR) repeat protein|nr:tetratricopeptide repeat protein [Puniceicoccales bacterium]